MSSNHGNGHETGRARGDDDRGEADVRRAWQALEHAEPPELVDLAVLNRARRELERNRRKRLRWIGSFATATVVVVALALVLQQGPQAPPPAPASEAERHDGLRLQPAPQMAAPRANREDKGQAFETRETASDELLHKRRGAAQPAPAAPAPATASARADADTESQPAEPLADEPIRERGEAETPEAWLERLVMLRETQQTEQLARELEAFRAAYPDYTLPAGFDGY